MLSPYEEILVQQARNRELIEEAARDRILGELPRNRARAAIAQLGCRLPVLRSAPACALSPAS